MMRLFVAFASVGLAACMCDPSAGTRNYRCATTADCADTYACVNSKCVSTGAGGSGGCGSAATETNCGDGVDDDCDHLTDCEDPDCSHQPCNPAEAAAVCCGAGSNATQCKDLSSDSANCGGCGLNCETGRSCRAQGTGSSATGSCACATSGDCPGLGQTCVAGDGVCTCGSSNSACASSERCITIGTNEHYCHY